MEPTVAHSACQPTTCYTLPANRPSNRIGSLPVSVLFLFVGAALLACQPTMSHAPSLLEGVPAKSAKPACHWAVAVVTVSRVAGRHYCHLQIAHIN